MVGSMSGRIGASEEIRGCVSQARPAAFIVSGRRFELGIDRRFRKPFFSVRKVVRMVFRPASGLGLLETLLDGTGSAGGTPNGEEMLFGTLAVRSTL